MLKTGQAFPVFEAPRLRGHAASFWKDAPEVISSQAWVGASPFALVIVKRDCPTCVYSFPFFNRLFQLHSGACPVVLLAQEENEMAHEMARENQLEMPVLLDAPPYRIGENLGVEFVPSGYLVSEDGTIERRFESFEREALEAIHERLGRFRGVSPPLLFEEGERVDAFRPG